MEVPQNGPQVVPPPRLMPPPPYALVGTTQPLATTAGLERPPAVLRGMPPLPRPPPGYAFPRHFMPQMAAYAPAGAPRCLAGMMPPPPVPLPLPPQHLAHFQLPAPPPPPPLAASAPAAAAAPPPLPPPLARPPAPRPRAPKPRAPPKRKAPPPRPAAAANDDGTLPTLPNTRLVASAEKALEALEAQRAALERARARHDREAAASKSEWRDVLEALRGNCRAEGAAVVEAWRRAGLTADLAAALLDRRASDAPPLGCSRDAAARAWRKALDPASAPDDEPAGDDDGDQGPPKRARRTARANAGQHREREDQKQHAGGDGEGPAGVAYRVGREVGVPRDVRLGLSPLVEHPDRVYCADHGPHRGPSALDGDLRAWEDARLEALELEGRLRRLDAQLATHARDEKTLAGVLELCAVGQRKAHARLAELEADYATLDEGGDEAPEEAPADT